ncbi:hypothetical protein [Nonomuraea sp. NPDC052265]|uniref:hypothetical protein n=1 Tax=Nonomuraea sp. NPDC052265 TaxID=3364374 RepID=UPI0037CC43C9
MAALAGAALVRRTRTVAAGFVPPDLPADRVFRRAALAGVGVYGGLFATMWAAPQLLAGVHGWSVLTIGAWLLPGALVGVVLARIAGARSWLLPAVAAAFAACLVAAGLAGVLAGVLGGGLTGAVLLVVAASLGFPAFSLAQVVIAAFPLAAALTRGGEREGPAVQAGPAGVSSARRSSVPR